MIPAQAINVDIEITDQTADIDNSGRSAPVKVTVRASAIVSVGEDEGMVNTAANKFFSKSGGEQLSTLTDVLSSLTSLIVTVAFLKVWKPEPDPRFAMTRNGNPSGTASVNRNHGSNRVGYGGWLPWIIVAVIVIFWVHANIANIGDVGDLARLIMPDTQLQRFLGGSPASVIVRLLVISLIVGDTFIVPLVTRPSIVNVDAMPSPFRSPLPVARKPSPAPPATPV